ncbi:MAG: pyruvate formate lyase 1-activating protein, partial [Erysipelotrichaceae bacterium]
VHTTIDTCGYPFTYDEPFFSKFQELMKYTDLILLDIKHINNQEHIKLTTKENTPVIELAKYLDKIHKPVWIRHVLIDTITDNDEYLQELREFIDTLSNVEQVDVLPYHSLGEFKYEQLGMKYPLKGILPPNQERIDNAKKILCK